MDHHSGKRCDQPEKIASPQVTTAPTLSLFSSGESGDVLLDMDFDLILANMDTEEFPVRDPAATDETLHHNPFNGEVQSPSFVLDNESMDYSTLSHTRYESSSAEESPCYSTPEFQFNTDGSSSEVDTERDAATSSQNLSSLAYPWHISTAAGNSESVQQPEISYNQTLHASPTTSTSTRLSRECLQILKKWPGLDSLHSYPSEEEIEMLQRRTGLSKTQIANWLVNARRRGKLQHKRSSFPQTIQSPSTRPIDIPRRPGTPAVESQMLCQDPLRRWVDSPPEDEPASVAAIARAIHSRPLNSCNSDFSLNRQPTAQESSLGKNSSTSSVGTSSTDSFAQSNASDGSIQTFSFNTPSHTNGRRRRRKRTVPNQNNRRTSLIVPLKPYQCTFCPETFKTKHDWQRHEKSFHLSLEMWICTPDEPRATNPKTHQPCCVFCGLLDPDDAHLEKHHHHDVCKLRKLEERTFYRKDHLNQHLKLVHNAMFFDWSMANWKIVKSDIRSRCGFCGLVMSNWPERTDHLAEHFKSGKSMADWNGDWGFEPSVLQMLANSIPPYLIQNEQQSPFPFVATVAPTESPRNAYELITLELAYFMANFEEKTSSLPMDRDIQLEACRIIYSSEVLSTQSDIASESSWLRDLIMSLDEIAWDARFAPLRRQAENKLAVLKINGKDNLFEQCPLEAQLNDFVRIKVLRGMAVSNEVLQEEACHIIRRMEKASILPCHYPAEWLIRLVKASSRWLANFRKRAHLPCYKDVNATVDLLKDTAGSIDSYTRLERFLGDYIDSLRARGVEPSSEELERKARAFIYQDGLRDHKVDNSEWAANFKKRHDQLNDRTAAVETQSLNSTTGNIISLNTLVPNPAVQSEGANCSPGTFEELMTNTFFLNDTDCYRRLAQELTRFVTSTMSPNNPNRHVPTDAEIQYQARWIMFDSDDPWNQTAADNSEWLNRFKRDVGILSPRA